MSQYLHQSRRLVALAILFTSPVAAQPVLYVDTAASGPVYDGSSWCSAFRHLQDALAVAVGGDEIRVADGTYRADLGAMQTLGDRDATFQLISGVAVRGGYAGCAALDPNERDFLAHETILSGDLLGNDGANFVNYDENTFHLVTGGTDASSVIDGFTIEAGRANDIFPGNSGGGMFNLSGAPTVSNCVFRRNWAHNGGGMVNFSSSPTVTNCTFWGNRGGLTGSGAGVGNFHTSEPVFINCTFLGNSGGIGGGMGNHSGDLHVTLINCVFSGNQAGFGGGVFNDYDGPSATIINSTFSGNIAGAAGQGGGILNYVKSGTNPAHTTLINCVLWNNIYNLFGIVGPSQLDGPNFTVDYSCIEGLTGTLGGVGNIGSDPLFVDADGSDNVVGTPDDDLRLTIGSPSIDAGINDGVSGGITFDRDELTRFVNVFSTPDTGNGVPPIVDMGAYEARLDCNDNGVSDDVDLLSEDSPDCNANLVPDECETLPDADLDGAPDCSDLCPGVDDVLFAPGCSGAIPTVSQWGLVVLALMLAVGAKIRFNLGGTTSDQR